MPVTQAFLDSYNDTNISDLRLMGQADKDAANTYFALQCDGTSYGTLDSTDSTQNALLNKFAIYDILLTTRIQ
jgi:hypothetical protein